MIATLWDSQDLNIVDAYKYIITLNNVSHTKAAISQIISTILGTHGYSTQGGSWEILCMLQKVVDTADSWVGS